MLSLIHILKKHIILLSSLLLILTLLVSGCQSQSTQPEQSADNGAEKGRNVTMILKNLVNPFCVTVKAVSYTHLGLHLKMPIRENIISASLKKLFPTAIINKRVELAKGEEYCKELKIATPNADKLVGELSGGNQQKVVVSKWLLTKAKLFIFDEPTRGIDVGAKAEIYQLLDTLAANGAGILMISSEMNEVVGLSDLSLIHI